MKKKDNPKNYTPSGNAWSCNNMECELRKTCFRTTYYFGKRTKSVDWFESEDNKCINYIKWDLNKIK
jgi:hypothetical protein